MQFLFEVNSNSETAAKKRKTASSDSPNPFDCLDSVANKLGFRAVDVPGDGLCFYHLCFSHCFDPSGQGKEVGRRLPTAEVGRSELGRRHNIRI